MKIRKYKKQDETKVKRIILSVLKTIYKKTLPKWENFEDYVMFYIAENKKEIIGTIALKKIDKNWVKLKRMYVKEDYQKKGIGKKLLEKALKLAKNKNYKKVILTTYPKMKNAVEFYKKQGFNIVKKPSNKFFTYPNLKEYNQRQIAMEKKL